MGAGDAWLQGGAALVLIVFASVVIRQLYTDTRDLRRRIDELTDSSLTLLTKYQERDAEELRELRRLREREDRA